MRLFATYKPAIRFFFAMLVAFVFLWKRNGFLYTYNETVNLYSSPAPFYIFEQFF